MKLLSWIAAVSLSGIAALGASAQTAVPSAFTYQGRLDSGGAPVSGLFDFRFRLYEFTLGGAQLGSTVCLDNVQVAADGTFSAPVDFGFVFGPIARFIEIEVRPDTGLGCANTTGYTLLSPRQSLMAAPLAGHALHANALDAPDGNPRDAVHVNNAGWVGVGTITPQGPFEVQVNGTAYLRVDSLNGDLHFNGGVDGFFGLYNDAPTNGRTEFLSPSGVNLSIANDGAIGMGALPVTGTRLKAAGIVEADEFRFATAKTVYISVDSSSFTPVVGETIGDTGEGRYTSGTNGIACSVSLPEGMVVTEIRWFVRDASSSDLSLNLLRRALPRVTGDPTLFVNQVFTSGTPGVTTMSAALNHTVSNQNATYHLLALPRISGNSWDSGRIGVQGVTIVGTVRNPR